MESFGFILHVGEVQRLHTQSCKTVVKAITAAQPECCSFSSIHPYPSAPSRIASVDRLEPFSALESSSEAQALRLAQFVRPKLR